jgi:hypothetical protein
VIKFRALLKKKAKIVWYPWADREQDTQYRTQAVIRQVADQQIIDGRHMVRFSSIAGVLGIKLPKAWNWAAGAVRPNIHSATQCSSEYLALGPVGSGKPMNYRI